MGETEVCKNFSELIAYNSIFRLNEETDEVYYFEIWDTYDERMIGWASIDAATLEKQSKSVMLVLQNEEKSHTQGILELIWAKDCNILIDETSKDIRQIRNGDLFNPFLKFVMSYEMKYKD